MTLSTNTEAVSELLPCPFCGAAGRIDPRDHGSFAATCSADCDAGIWLQYATETEVVTAWNRRSASNAGGVEVKADWGHIVNEWADGMTNCIQWFRNIRDEFSSAQDALDNVEPQYERVLTMSRAALCSLAVEAEPVAWLCNGMGSGWIERDKITFDREAAEHMAAQEVWTVVPLYTHPSSSVSAEVTATHRHVKSGVKDTWFTDRALPVMALSGDIESDHVIKLHFRRPVTDADRQDITNALNLHNAAKASPATMRPVSNDMLEWLEMARELIREAKGAEGPSGGFVTDHLDAAENWMDKIESALASINGGRENG